MPDVDADPDILALLERLNGDEYEELMEPYLAQLGLRLHERLGVLVIVDGMDVSYGAPEREQLLAQLTPEQLAEWTENDWLPRNRQVDGALASLDVLFSERIDHDRVAAVYRRNGILYGDARLSGTKFGRELRETVTQLGDQPCVVAGLLPAGAVSASVQDLFDVWHDAHAGEGAWLCVLPHEARGGYPPVAFRDAAGAEIAPAPRAPERPLAELHLSVPEGWAPDPAVGGARVRDGGCASCGRHARRSCGRPLRHARRDCGAGGRRASNSTMRRCRSRSISSEHQFDAPLREARQRIEWRLQMLGERAAARAALEAVASSLPGTVGERSVEFACAAGGGWWAAAWSRHDLGVVVVGQGEPPARLDLGRLRPEDVDLRV